MRTIILFSFLFLFSKSHALVIFSDSSSSAEKHRKFKMELDYSSDNTFKGRKDTTNIPILAPFFKYTAKSGFFLQASLVNVPTPKANKQKVFDELDAGLGWMFDFSDKWDGIISYTHYFFDSKIARIKAAVQNDLNATVGYDWDVLYHRLIIDYNSGNPNFVSKKGKKISTRSRDFSITLANSHNFSFDFSNNKNFTIAPEADALFGTQNFLASYKGKTSDATYQKQASAFNLTAFMFYLTVSYEIKKWTFMLDPSYTIPQNVPNGESSSPYFVMSGSIYITFKSKRKK